MPVHLPVLGTVVAAAVGLAGAPAPPAVTLAAADRGMSVCSSAAGGGSANLDEVREKIRDLVAELKTLADRTGDSRATRATEMVELASPVDRSALCESRDDEHSGFLGLDIVRAVGGLAAVITEAVSGSVPTAGPGDSGNGGSEDSGDGGSEDSGDDGAADGGSEDSGDGGSGSEDSDDGGGQADQENGGGGVGNQPTDPGGNGNGGAPRTRQQPTPAPIPPTEPSTPRSPEPTAPDARSTGAAEQLIRDLGALLRESADPATRKLGEDLLNLLSGSSALPPVGDASGGAIDQTLSMLPAGVTELFRDDFETGDLAKWGSCQGAGINGDCASATAADGMGVVEDPERGLVAQFSVADGKEAEMGGERSEVRDDNNPGTLVKEGDERWYAWSMKFPADLPEPDGGWNILMQWHQSADSGSPPLALDISQGSLDIGGDGADAPRQTIGPIRRGEWVDYVLHVGFSQTDGFVEAWENGVQTVPRTTRQTMADEASYLKMGIYRDEGATGDAAVLFDDLTILGGGAGGSEPRTDAEPRTGENPGTGRSDSEQRDPDPRDLAARRIPPTATPQPISPVTTAV
jgi:hypothetical protein